MLQIFKYYRYTKNRYILRQNLIKKFGKKEGLKKFNKILIFYKKKKKIMKKMDM